MVGRDIEMSWTDILKFAWQVLNYHIIEFDGYAITLGKLLMGLLLILLGYMVSRRIATLMDRRVLGRLNLEESLRYTFRRLIFYFSFLFSILFTLHVLNVPITIFTVMGGALAVGIGFGSQNLVNNFISGLLVMAERPIRVGDYVEVEGLIGEVQTIGIRSTELRTTSNLLVVIPNTTFIEKSLINWTKSGEFSGFVRFGVAYGTDTDRLREACMAVVREIPEIRLEPEPRLNFIDFGDSALTFELTYTLPARMVPLRRRIESDIRFKLNRRFNEAKIEVPFPQRVVRVMTDQSAIDNRSQLT